MNPSFKPLLMVLSLALSSPAGAALMHIEFSGGGSETTMAPGDTARIDLVWTMQTTDTSASRLTGTDLRFNVTSTPDPDGPERGDKYVVESLTTPIPTWSTAAASGVGSFFSGNNFFLSAIDPVGVSGIVGNGTEFSTIIASFVLRKEDFAAGDTYITFRHRFPNAILPVAYNGLSDWTHQFQGTVTGPNQFRLGLGNPGDAGPQWDPYHGYETFQPLIIHNVPEPSSMLLLLVSCAIGLRQASCGRGRERRFTPRGKGESR